MRDYRLAIIACLEAAADQADKLVRDMNAEFRNESGWWERRSEPRRTVARRTVGTRNAASAAITAIRKAVEEMRDA